MSRNSMVQIGPCPIPLVPVRDFSKPRLTREDWNGLWQLCGPSAQHNLSRNPLWVVICMAYYEGMAHASGLLEEQGKVTLQEPKQ
ncbi:hypothetical protein [Paraburkholderia susongensis]|uniref:Uncharacterized protein n=1 Tax=Paraburkholderia susongensis TaxID=1515439 RepID=A0A1X7I7M4_9BURK|nr:hypothetical protein [Paraburkholderia susongensis]SMG09866.1 hypothetical protein SAMN06265784_101357 [Paraburkholderia susongensis]